MINRIAKINRPTKKASGATAERLPMVRWYQPLLLLRTGARALLATVVGQLADNRELQALDHRAQANQWDYSRSALSPDEPTNTPTEAAQEDFWFDFVADMGDGWEPSHAIAAALAEPELLVGDTLLPRGELLVLGGDLVYPDPSLDAYARRTLAPYQVACEGVEPFQADVFAVPGNHDWYDGLRAFQDVFCHDSEERPEWSFGHWRKVQTHSYFSLQLPRGWWLLAPDVQLDNQLNPAQRAYFRASIARMQPGERVIIISPYPHWAQIDPNANGAVVAWLADLCARHDVQISTILTGDLHHYSRYSATNKEPSASNKEPSEALRNPDTSGAGIQLITAGGGGAFVHPTHQLASSVELTTLPDANQPRDFQLQSSYPSPTTSRRLSRLNLLFPITNWELSLFVGCVYTILAWLLETRLLVGDQQVGELFQAMLSNHGGVGETLTRVLAMLPKSPEFALAVVLTGLGLTAFNENCTRRTRLTLGIIHTLLHLVGLILTYCVAIEITDWLYTHMQTLSFSFFWFLLTMVLFGGGVGGVVIGVYLLLSLNLFGANLTNAFSSLRLASHKNFLRLQITQSGELVIHPLGMDDPGGEKPQIHAIEAPIVL